MNNLLLNQLTYQYAIGEELIELTYFLLKIHCDVTNSFHSSHRGHITEEVLLPLA